MERDMTQGNLAKILVLFTVPLVLSGLFQQLFNWVDAFIVGNVEGETALAAIGATSAIYHLFIMVITGFTSGLSILTAQQYGMGETASLKNALSSFVVILGAVFLLLASLGVVFTSHILTLLDTPPNLFVIAKEYLRVLFFGIPFLAIYNVYAAVLRGLGDSRAPFLSVLVSSLANVGLDILFVAVLGYGAAGAAVATVISQAAMTVFIVLYATKKHRHLRFRFGRSMVDKTLAAKGAAFGLPPAVQSGMSSVGNLFLQRFMNSFGEQTVAAITTAYRVDSVLFLPIINFGSGIATVVAQNIGAGNHERAEKALKIGLMMMAGIAISLALLVLLTGEYLLAMFGLTASSVAIGKSFFHAIAGFYVVYGASMAMRGYLEGTGDMLFSGLCVLFALLVRIAASYLFAAHFGNMVVAYAEAFSWFVLLALYISRYLQKRPRTKRNGELSL
ncbi:MATE family efflux transporter [Christensenellaceae bacterium OttesenSCG-928-L17]|nr:MATE family efflux transporter [Christensenellaceae bacterium OttesenSCG-928-L17]